MNIDIFSYKPKSTVARIIILAIISYLILILFGWSLYPFNDKLSCDAIVFKMMGISWREGYIPYRDFFDHKGPLHYLIQLICFSISNGKAGLLLLETINTVIIFEFIYRCGKELGANKKLNLLSLFVSMNLFAVFLSQGNNVEEWSLPFQIIPLWLAIKYLRGSYFSAKRLALICGLCFGTTAMIRLNNNCIVCGIVFGLTIVLLLNKSYKELLACVAYFIVGMVAIILPFVVYFYLNDALTDMIYCNLIFNIHYKSNPQFSTTAITILIVLPLIQCLILPFTSWLYDRRNHTMMFPMMTAMSLLSFYVYVFSAGFNHYFLMVLPITALCILTTCREKAIISILVSLVMILPIVKVPYNRTCYISAIQRIIAHEIISKYGPIDIIEYIPEQERNSVYTYGWFDGLESLLHANALPVGKYAFIQQKLCKVDSVVYQDIRKRFFEANPKWIISSIPIEEMTPINVKNGYELIHQENEYYLYRRKN